MSSGTTQQLRASGGPSEQLLLLLNDHRVMTTDQLARATATPARTVLYRLEQLRTAGMVDYDRPGRHTGSAPHHWWLRPAGARLITGTAAADGRRPSAMFSAHAATITEVWLALRDHGPPAGLTMTGWATDRAGWQEWDGPTSAWGGTTTKRLTPDAVYEATLPDGRTTAAFVEIDLASMTQNQLRAKLDRYRAYTRDQAWQGRFPHCPPLLLFTTTAHRAVTFTRNAAKHLREEHNPSRYRRRPVTDGDLIAEHGRLIVAATGLVRDPARAVTAHAWNLTDPEAAETTLTAVLDERATVTAAAQPAYHREHAAELARQRSHTLHTLARHPQQLEPDLGPAAVDLLAYLFDRDHDPRNPFTPDLDTSSVLAALADWWRQQPDDPTTAKTLRTALTRAHHTAWSHQVHQLAHLTATGGDRPAWYTAATRLARPRLLTPTEHHRLDHAHTREQAQVDVWRDWQPPDRHYGTRLTYAQWRDEHVDRRWRALSWWQRHHTHRDTLTAAFDDERLTACARCALTLPTNDTDNCPGCHHHQRLPHTQRHSITPLADLITALLAKAADDPRPPASTEISTAPGRD
ncbi:protein involved in plasmid replication-relaxation [Micromonospora sp. Llam0]|uniref:replication-relaxation family protein n=1 Tax=Micromonospora sp. Llam0 TaxID=2485143 RepID=UPI000F49FEC6|nr:replication-relaxation family protein [Micromonospora sp. Llam0]ROO62908.1 protein involved in plasmid replication-relaxation [Micromonospora sp. Llam0]